MPAPKKYPDEVRERAVRMVFEVREESGQQQGAIARVADRLGVNRETLRNWVRRAEVDGGQRAGTSTADARRIAELEREVRELRRANEILKAASVFFPRGLKGCGVGDVGGHPRSAGRPPAPKPECSPTHLHGPSSWAVTTAGGPLELRCPPPS